MMGSVFSVASAAARARSAASHAAFQRPALACAQLASMLAQHRGRNVVAPRAAFRQRDGLVQVGLGQFMLAGVHGARHALQAADAVVGVVQLVRELRVALRRLVQLVRKGRADNDEGPLSITLASSAVRFGGLFGAEVAFSYMVSFFDDVDTFLGSVAISLGEAGSVFAGWESAGGVRRLEVVEAAADANFRVVSLEQLRFENQVPEPSSLLFMGLALAGLANSRRRSAAH